MSIITWFSLNLLPQLLFVSKGCQKQTLAAKYFKFSTFLGNSYHQSCGRSEKILLRGDAISTHVTTTGLQFLDLRTRGNIFLPWLLQDFIWMSREEIASVFLAHIF